MGSAHLLSPSGNRRSLSRADLRDLSAAELESFEVSTSGSRLRWPDTDVDLSLESIQAVADPGVRARHERQCREAARGYGQAIRRLRQQHRLAQSDIAGLSDRAVRRIEQGERIPHAATLVKLAGAHGMTVDRYMDALARLSGEGVPPTGPRKPRRHKPPRSRR
jgi:DNA-binding transcriptional regulator YiaG